MACFEHSINFCWTNESEIVIRATLQDNAYFSILQMWKDLNNPFQAVQWEIKRAEELNEFCIRWVVGIKYKVPIFWHSWILCKCVGQGWSPIGVEGFTPKLMQSLEEFSCLQVAGRRLASDYKPPSVPHHVVFSTGSSQYGSLLLKTW